MPYPQAVLDVADRVRNWGRWGDDDQIGTLNLLTDDVVRSAATSIRSGRRFSLAYPLQLNGLQTGAIPGRINPLRTMVAINACFTGDPTTFCTSDDVVTMGLQAATHWDGLGHASYDGKIYGGRDASTITEWGAASRRSRSMASSASMTFSTVAASMRFPAGIEPRSSISARRSAARFSSFCWPNRSVTFALARPASPVAVVRRSRTSSASLPT